MIVQRNVFMFVGVIFFFFVLPQGGFQQPKPDLIGSVKCPITAYPGDELASNIKVLVKNVGLVAAKNSFFVDIVLSHDTDIPLYWATYSPTFKEDVLLLGGRESVELSGIGVWKKVPIYGKNKIPADTPPGDYFIGISVDPGNTIKESNEKNNTATSPIRILPCDTVADVHDCQIVGASGGTVGFALLNLEWSYTESIMPPGKLVKPKKLLITVYRREAGSWVNVMPQGQAYDVASPSSTTNADVKIFRLFSAEYKIVMEAHYQCDRQKEFIFERQIKKSEAED